MVAILPTNRSLSVACRLLILGAALEGTYLFAVVRPLWLWDSFPGPKTRLRGIVGADIESLLWYTLTVTALFTLYALACWSCRGHGSPFVDKVAIFSFPVLFAGTLLLMFPATSLDIFHYILQARVLWEHGDNPLTTAAAAFPSDPYYSYADWREFPSPYGPLWSILTFLPTRIPGQHVVATLLAFKALTVTFYLGTAVLIWLLVSHIKPEARRFATVLYAWNPLILLMVAGNGHNDTVMLFFLMLALYLAVKERWQLALPALTLSILSKYVAGILLPLLVIHAWNRTSPGDRKSFYLGLAWSGLVALLIYLPFWAGGDTFNGLQQGRGWFVYSIPELMLFGFERWMSTDEAMNMARLTGLLLYAVPYVALLWRVKTTSGDLLTCSYHAVFLYLLLATTLFEPWYIIWVVSLGALLGFKPWSLLAMLFSFTGLFLDAVWELAWPLGFLDQNVVLGRIFTVSVVFGPPALAWLYISLRNLSRLWVCPELAVETVQA